MVYRKYYKKAKKIYRQGKKAYGTGKQLYRDVQKLKSMVNVEHKFTDLQQLVTIDDDWTFYPLSMMQEGDDQNQRNGRKVKAESNYLNGQFYIDSAAAKTNIRCILFIDNDPDGEGVTWSEIFDYNDIQSPLNRANAGKRFKIIADYNIDLSINGTETKTLKSFRKLWHHVTYLGTTALSGSQGPGQVFMGLIANEPVNQPTFNFINRFSYIDN